MQDNKIPSFELHRSVRKVDTGIFHPTQEENMLLHDVFFKGEIRVKHIYTHCTKYIRNSKLRQNQPTK
jgi:hypothetical protein